MNTCCRFQWLSFQTNFSKMVAAFKVVDNAVVVIDYAETKSRVSNIEMENKAILRHKTRNRAVAAKNVKIAEVRSFSGEVDDERPWQLTTRASDSQVILRGERSSITARRSGMGDINWFHLSSISMNSIVALLTPDCVHHQLVHLLQGTASFCSSAHRLPES
ncbi:uncharacterized protein LOC121767952 isoform X2 [Salvia splendens]|uniref:uncharacterized protein LOC121767952 isoform X2 n=2 Tax=Salvia splendens TaxID=180675 RepID=UPI001C275188|nr:uncharacterized protein LOC121767952 isoform X2 [Salvia splendens]